MNLKEAARRLEVHYQTAYRYVRDGRLAAVRVGCTYEISESAVEQFLAQSEAARRVPLNAREPQKPSQFVTPLRTLLGDVRAAYDAMTLSPAGVFDVVADGLARVVGDLAVVRTVSDDLHLHPCAISHRDPRRLSIAWTQADTYAPTATEYHERVAVTTGKPVLIRHVPQDQLPRRHRRSSCSSSTRLLRTASSAFPRSTSTAFSR